MRKELIEKTEKALVLSFLMGMDHAESKIEMEDIIPEPISFEEAIDLFRMRVPMTKKEWNELEKRLRFRAFTVARLTELDAIEAIRRRVLKVLEEGKTLSQFWDEAGRDELLRRAGFYRGDPWYWETVFRTNIQTAYNAGRAYQFKRNPPAYLEFVGITDVRQTPMCRARSGVIRRSDDPFWDTNWPPLHYNCRSTVRGVHKEEVEAFELRETARLPEDNPAKGFGLNPLKSDSFWKMTDMMAERAKKYGIIDEIEKVAKKLELNIKDLKMELPKEVKKPSAFIDNYEFNSMSDVEKMLRDFAKGHTEMFRSGFKGLKVVDRKYFMGTRPETGEFFVSRRPYYYSGKPSENFVPSRDLLEALRKIKKRERLTFTEEYAIECLWHEINHNRVNRYVWLGKDDTPQARIMETINQLVSRYTYDKFLKLLGGKAYNKARILRQGLAYESYVYNFRQLLNRLKIKEREFIKDLEPVLFEDYGKIYETVINKLVPFVRAKDRWIALNNVAIAVDKIDEDCSKYLERLNDLFGG